MWETAYWIGIFLGAVEILIYNVLACVGNHVTKIEDLEIHPTRINSMQLDALSLKLGMMDCCIH